MPRIQSDDPETVVACPECDHVEVYEREGNGNAHLGDPDDPFACTECGATFEEYVEREPKDARPPGKTETYGLADLSPEDVGLSPMGERS